jgi:hypothetical protein
MLQLVEAAEEEEMMDKMVYLHYLLLKDLLMIMMLNLIGTIISKTLEIILQVR